MDPTQNAAEHISHAASSSHEISQTHMQNQPAIIVNVNQPNVVINVQTHGQHIQPHGFSPPTRVAQPLAHTSRPTPANVIDLDGEMCGSLQQPVHHADIQRSSSIISNAGSIAYQFFKKQNQIQPMPTEAHKDSNVIENQPCINEINTKFTHLEISCQNNKQSEENLNNKNMQPQIQLKNKQRTQNCGIGHQIIIDAHENQHQTPVFKSSEINYTISLPQSIQNPIQIKQVTQWKQNQPALKVPTQSTNNQLKQDHNPTNSLNLHQNNEMINQRDVIANKASTENTQKSVINIQINIPILDANQLPAQAKNDKQFEKHQNQTKKVSNNIMIYEQPKHQILHMHPEQHHHDHLNNHDQHHHHQHHVITQDKQHHTHQNQQENLMVQQQVIPLPYYQHQYESIRISQTTTTTNIKNQSAPQSIVCQPASQVQNVCTTITIQRVQPIAYQPSNQQNENKQHKIHHFQQPQHFQKSQFSSLIVNHDSQQQNKQKNHNIPQENNPHIVIQIPDVSQQKNQIMQQYRDQHSREVHNQQQNINQNSNTLETHPTHQHSSHIDQTQQSKQQPLNQSSYEPPVHTNSHESHQIPSNIQAIKDNNKSSEINQIISINGQSVQLTDINEIRQLLLSSLPEQFQDQIKALADQQLRQMYFQIRSEEMKVAAAQASAMAPVNNIQEEAVHELHTKNNNNTSNNNIGDVSKKIQQKPKESKNSHQHQTYQVQKKKDSPKKQAPTSKKQTNYNSNSMINSQYPVIDEESKSSQLPNKSMNIASNTNAASSRRHKRQRKRVVTTVVQQVQYFDQSDGELPSKTTVLQNGETIRKKKGQSSSHSSAAPQNRTQMQSILNQLCNLVKTLDLTALGGGSTAYNGSSNKDKDYVVNMNNNGAMNVNNSNISGM